MKDNVHQNKIPVNHTLPERINEQANLSINTARSSKILYVITTSPSHPTSSMPGNDTIKCGNGKIHMSQSSLLTEISFSDLYATEGHKLVKKKQTLLVESRIAWNAFCIPVTPINKASSIIQRGLDKLMGVGGMALRTVMCLELTFRTSLNSGNYWAVNNWRLAMHSWWISLLFSPIVKPLRASAFICHWSWPQSHWGHSHSTETVCIPNLKLELHTQTSQGAEHAQE